MSDYTFPPSLVPFTQEWTLITNSVKFVSPFTGGVRTAVRKGGRWHQTLHFRNLIDSEAGTLRGHLNRLNGQEHRTLIGDPTHQLNLSVGGSPLVNGGSQTGTSLAVDGGTGTWNVGDIFSFTTSVGLELKEVVVAGAASGSTLVIAPEIHNSPANNAAIDHTSPLGRFMLVEDPSWSRSPGGNGGILHDVSFSLVEDIS